MMDQQPQARKAYLLLKDHGVYVGVCMDKAVALKGAEREAEESGILTYVAEVPVIAAFGPLSRLESGVI